MAENSDTTDYSAMTVNERLVTAGLLHEFDVAARRRDRAAMLEILSRVALSERDAAACADAVLARPGGYGY